MVCPDSPALLLNNATKNFCCGISGSQYCCSESEFRQGIQIIRPSLAISPSVLIGCALAALLAMMIAALLVYGRLHPNRNSRQPVSIIYPQNQLYSSGGSHTRKKSASTVPPTGRLLSSDSDRQSMRHNRRSPIEYSV
ncbi:jumonji domain containing protein [Echinococcus multilocularis]|uniref:Jumonji domain containing protein n=1 Tax=Echinococcus multilocularis TaxID=6211 RepID=A0A068Y406_ECHMU|nr:jumonji domain containing protein [Echinococcus multilocularis]